MTVLDVCTQYRCTLVLEEVTAPEKSYKPIGRCCDEVAALALFTRSSM